MTSRSVFTAAAEFGEMRHSLAGRGATGGGTLTRPANGRIPVAFVITEGVVVIDYCGPWEVFQDTTVPIEKVNVPGFQLYTVSDNTQPVTVSGGMKVIPNYSFEDAPPPKVIVIPAQRGSDAMLDWIRKASKTADLTMPVCTGAFHLAKTGLLAGKAATTHHGSYGRFAMQYRDIRLKRGFRFVEAGDNLASAGGLTSGMDLALRVVERYYGPFIAERTAFFIEDQRTGRVEPTAPPHAL